MGADSRQDFEDRVGPRVDSAISSTTATTTLGLGPDAAVGSAEQLHTIFLRAAAVADRAVGLWLARDSMHSGPHDVQPSEPAGATDDLRTLRALARAAATAYARRLRDDGLTPERMLVLVKTAANQNGSPGYGAQELTNDIVRWSIEAYFDD